MKKAIIGGAALVAVGWVGASFAQVTAERVTSALVTTKVLVPKAGGAKLTNTAPPATIKPAPVGGTEQATLTKQIAAAKPANLPVAATRSAFTVGPANMLVNGVEVYISNPDGIWEYGAAMSSTRQSVFTIRGIPDGAWYVDCSVWTDALAPFEVASESSQNGTVVASATSSIAPVSKHLLFGIFMSGGATANPVIKYEGNLIRIVRPTGGFYTWAGCTFTPVN